MSMRVGCHGDSMTRKDNPAQPPAGALTCARYLSTSVDNLPSAEQLNADLLEVFEINFDDFPVHVDDNAQTDNR